VFASLACGMPSGQLPCWSSTSTPLPPRVGSKVTVVPTQRRGGHQEVAEAGPRDPVARIELASEVPARRTPDARPTRVARRSASVSPPRPVAVSADRVRLARRALASVLAEPGLDRHRGRVAIAAAIAAGSGRSQSRRARPVAAPGSAGAMTWHARHRYPLRLAVSGIGNPLPVPMVGPLGDAGTAGCAAGGEERSIGMTDYDGQARARWRRCEKRAGTGRAIAIVFVPQTNAGGPPPGKGWASGRACTVSVSWLRRVPLPLSGPPPAAR
jgi:hypothetical protein